MIWVSVSIKYTFCWFVCLLGSCPLINKHSYKLALQYYKENEYEKMGNNYKIRHYKTQYLPELNTLLVVLLELKEYAYI